MFFIVSSPDGKPFFQNVKATLSSFSWPFFYDPFYDPILPSEGKHFQRLVPGRRLIPTAAETASNNMLCLSSQSLSKILTLPLPFHEKTLTGPHFCFIVFR